MPAKIEYKDSVASDLRRLDSKAALRVLRRIEQALGSGGVEGTPLTGEFSGLWRLRVGDCRVIYARTGHGYLVLYIGHRREVYKRGRP